MGLVLLHAGVLDRRIQHIVVDHVLTSYRSLIDAPLPTGAPEDVIPGVLLHYDIPDLVRALGHRLKETNPLNGANDLSQEFNAAPGDLRPNTLRRLHNSAPEQRHLTRYNLSERITPEAVGTLP